MSYVSRILQPGERIVYETGLHWLPYLPAILLLVVAAALAVTAFQIDPTLALIALVAAAVLALAGLIVGLVAAVRRAGTELVVTNHRVIFKRGLIGRHTIEMNRAKVESVDVDQSLMGRLLGYGTVTIHGTGGSLEPLRNVSHPLTLRSHITVEDPPTDAVR
jgi:uncharacterized membrane protein YdbT with pleckstrin-like domain